MDADATKPQGTPETVTPNSDSLITQNEAQEDLHKPSMAHTQCAQETATDLERTVSTEPKANEKLDADVNTQNVAPDEGGGAAECGDQKTAVKIPREHARLDALLSQIPKKAQQGLLMQCDLILTCIDASEHYIALGTNIGLTFLYDRKDHSMQRLKSEVFFLSCYLSFIPALLFHILHPSFSSIFLFFLFYLLNSFTCVLPEIDQETHHEGQVVFCGDRCNL